MMTVAVDLDGTIDAFPAQLKEIMGALREYGAQVVVITGQDSPKVTPEDYDLKGCQLSALGFDGCYDFLCVVGGPQERVAQNKAAYMRSIGAMILIDNDERNIRAAAEAGILGLLVWNARSLTKNG